MQRRHGSRWANQILLAKFEICTHNYANASVFSVAEFRARNQRPLATTTVKLYSTGCTWQPLLYTYIYIYSSENAQSWQIERLNKYSAPIRDRYLFERQHSKVLEESWREVWTHLCIKRDSSLIGGVSSLPRIASCAPNFATVREFTARSFRHSGKNGSRLNVNCSVIFPPRAYLINRNAILNGEGEGNGVASELEANLLTEKQQSF